MASFSLTSSRAFELLNGTEVNVDDFLEVIPALRGIPPRIRERLGWEGTVGETQV